MLAFVQGPDAIRNLGNAKGRLLEFLVKARAINGRNIGFRLPRLVSQIVSATNEVLVHRPMRRRAISTQQHCQNEIV